MIKVEGNYEKVMEFVYELKDKVYQETKDLAFPDYLKYIKESLRKVDQKYNIGKVVMEKNIH